MSEQTTSTNQVRILIVDDHPTTATTLARAISQLGPEIKVTSATSGKMAMEKMGEDGVDLLITDMMMPDMNGLELIKSLQTHPAGRPGYIILITAYDVPGLKESARRLKVNEIIIKPFRPERISEIVSNALEEMGHSKPSEQPVAQRQPFKVLIADDVPDNVMLLSRYLTSEGFTLVTASTGIAALEKTRSEMPDLILLDVNMPEKDGFEVLKEIRLDPALQHIPVIILTAARPDALAMQFGLNLGADDYVTKPFDRRELLARMRTKLRAKEADEVVRRRYKELSVLPEIGRDLSARLDINELADVVLHRTVETLGAMLGHLIIFNPGAPLHKEYNVSTSATFKLKLSSFKDLVDEMKETHLSIIIDDAHNHLHWKATDGDPSGSMIITPMFGRFDLLGYLVLIHEKPGYFNSEYQLLLQSIASQAAIAVENAQLYADMEQQRQQLAAVLQTVSDAILTFDADGRLGSLNPAGEKMFKGFEIRLGQPLVRGAGYDLFIELLEEARSSGSSKSGQILWPDQRTFSISLTPIHEGGFVASLHEVSLKEMENTVSDPKNSQK